MASDTFFRFVKRRFDRRAVEGVRRELAARYGAPNAGDEPDGVVRGSIDLRFARFAVSLTEHPGGCYVHVSGERVPPDALDDAAEVVRALEPILGGPLEEDEWSRRADAHLQKRQAKPPAGPRSTAVLVGTDMDGNECARGTLPLLRYYSAANQPAHPLLSDQGRMKANVHRMTTTLYDSDGNVSKVFEQAFDGYGRVIGG
jgi:hypothetical protein